MQVIWKLMAVCLLGFAALGRPAVAGETRSDTRGGSSKIVGRGEPSQAAPARSSYSWRMVWKDRVWWYWTPQNTWLAWNGKAWVRPTSAQLNGAAYAAGNQGFEGTGSPSEQQVNSAGMTGLGYEGLAMPAGNPSRQVRTRQSNALPSEQQVNSAGMTGLGYDGLAMPANASSSEPMQVLTSQQDPNSDDGLPSEEQVNSAGTTGLGDDGLE